MNRYAAIIDACVLGGGLKRNIILSLAEVGLFRPYWSERILDETEKAIWAISKGTADPSRQRRAIERAFPEAMVFPNTRADLPGLLPDPGDEHVLAAAIAAHCDTLVTDNLKDFPQLILDHWGIEVMSPDDFISNAMDLDHAVAIGALRDMRVRLKNPKYTVSALVNRPGFTGGQNSRRIARYGTCTKEEDVEAVFTRVPRTRGAAFAGTPR